LPLGKPEVQVFAHNLRVGATLLLVCGVVQEHRVKRGRDGLQWCASDAIIMHAMEVMHGQHGKKAANARQAI
jgi:hypothetical protein